MTKESLNKIAKEIRESLDGIVEMLKEPQEISPIEILDKIYPIRVLLAQHYDGFDKEEAKMYKERLEIIDRIIEDIYSRKRIEDLHKWSGDKPT